MDASEVCGSANFTAQSINFPGQMSFGGASNGGITAHAPDCFQFDGKKCGVQSTPGCCQGCFDSGMSCSHYN
jgi:hypothetical protein